MKRILIAVSAALLLAACNNKNSASTAGGAVTGADSSQSAVAAGGDIAYFNIDSLVSRYDMYIDLRAAYEQKAKKADTELTSKGRSLENDVRDYQDKIQKGLVTRSQAQSIEENLNKKQQSFMQHRDQVMSELAEEEQAVPPTVSITALPEYLNRVQQRLPLQDDPQLEHDGPGAERRTPSLDLTQIILGDSTKSTRPKSPRKRPKA